MVCSFFLGAVVEDEGVSVQRQQYRSLSDDPRICVISLAHRKQYEHTTEPGLWIQKLLKLLGFLNLLGEGHERLPTGPLNVFAALSPS